MIYHRGKIRCSQATIFVIPRWNQIRFNSIISDSNNSNNTENIDDNLSIAKGVILALPSSNKQKSYLEPFLRADFHKFRELSKPLIKPSKLLPPRTEYSMDELNRLLKQNDLKRTILYISQEFLKGRYLTLLEFQSLFIQFINFNWYACQLLQLYHPRLDYPHMSSKMQVLLMRVAFDNCRFKIFDKIFQVYQIKTTRIDDNILLAAIQVYLKTENIQIATQLFNQQVMTETSLPNRLLDVYISNLYNKTKNVALCFTSYRLWVSKKLDTNISIDSFMYNLLLEAEMSEEIEWMERSLEERGLIDKFVIKFGTLCNRLSRNYEEYAKFNNNSEDMEIFQNLAKMDDEIPSLLNNLTYLHLRHKNYEDAIENFLQITDRKNFQMTIFTILRHFEKEENPEMIFQILKKLREESKFQIHWTHILLYWRTLIKKYPQIAYSIHLQFKNKFKRSVYHRYSFMSYIFQVRGQKSSEQTGESRGYPVVHYNNIISGLKPLNALPQLLNIESRLRNGIFPNAEMLRKSIILTKDEREFVRLVEIYNQMRKQPMMVKGLNVRLNVEIFFKECSFRYKSSNEQFAREQIKLIEKLDYAEDVDLIELFRFCIKFDLYAESLIVLNMFQKYRIEIVSDQKALRFVSFFMKWCWSYAKFRELGVLLEWLKRQESVVIDEFFWVNLKDSADRCILKLTEKLDKGVNGGEISSLEENERIRNVLPQLRSYYLETVEEVQEMRKDESKKIVDQCSASFEYLVKWVDEDTESYFE